jgi:hypothetical protein
MPIATDEVTWVKDGDVDILRIKSCQPKPNRENHPAIRYKGEFFKAVKAMRVSSPLSYVYHLRRLQPGEISRGLEDYQPQDESPR